MVKATIDHEGFKLSFERETFKELFLYFPEILKNTFLFQSVKVNRMPYFFKQEDIFLKNNLTELNIKINVVNYYGKRHNLNVVLKIEKHEKIK